VSKNSIKPSATLIEAINAIESTEKRLAVVVSDENRVVGTLTDGDIRRHVLKGLSLSDLAIDAMSANPIVASVDTADSVLRKILANGNIRSLPLVDGLNKYVRTLHEMELGADHVVIRNGKRFSAAIIMAGGEGTRLRPLTNNMPKPMVDINGLPLLERQIRSLSNIGINLIYISVNYLSEVIENYFRNGERFGVEIQYLHEGKKLGTAGALSLLPDLEAFESVLVMNGDILTTSDFVNLLHFHTDQCAEITVGAVDYNIQIPYGVIQHDGVQVIAIQEKPSQHFLCNAGIYALSVKALRLIPTDTFFNMTDLIEQCLSEGLSISVFPVHEYWSDIGTKADLDRARVDFMDL